MKIEDMIKEIDDIVNELKNNNADIDESIELYKKGITLTNNCLKELEEKELKIRLISGEDFEL